MRYAFCAILVFAMTASHPARAIDRDSAFETANARYNAGSWGDAASIYKSIADEGNAGSELYLNLGSALYQMDRKGEALYYFRQALRLDPQDNALRRNIAIVADELDVALPPSPQRHDRIMFSLWLAGCLVLGLAALLYAVPSIGRGAVRGSTILGVAIVIAAIGWSASADIGGGEGLVVRGPAPVYETADDLSTRGVILREGQSVAISEASGARVLVEARGDVFGWVDRHRVREF